MRGGVRDVHRSSTDMRIDKSNMTHFVAELALLRHELEEMHILSLEVEVSATHTHTHTHTHAHTRTGGDAYLVAGS